MDIEVLCDSAETAAYKHKYPQRISMVLGYAVVVTIFRVLGYKFQDQDEQLCGQFVDWS